MSLAFDRLQYMLKTKTVSGISKETGIPYSSLYRMSKGEGDIMSKYNNDLRNAYSRTVYGNLRGEGFSSNQANRFRWYVPETVESYTMKWREKLTEWSKGIATNRMALYGETYSKTSFDEYFTEAYTDVLESLRKSPKPVESILEGNT